MKNKPINKDKKPFSESKTRREEETNLVVEDVDGVGNRQFMSVQSVLKKSI